MNWINLYFCTCMLQFTSCYLLFLIVLKLIALVPCFHFPAGIFCLLCMRHERFADLRALQVYILLLLLSHRQRHNRG